MKEEFMFMLAIAMYALEHIEEEPAPDQEQFFCALANIINPDYSKLIIDKEYGILSKILQDQLSEKFSQEEIRERFEKGIEEISQLTTKNV